MAFYGSIPAFVPTLVPGQSLLLPVPLELQTPTESSNIVAQHFNVVSLCTSAKLGAIFPTMELRELFPAVAAVPAAVGQPKIIRVAAEVGPIPITFSNYRIPMGAYQLLSANSQIVSLGCVLNLNGSGGSNANRYSLLPHGIDVLPKLITLPAAHASSLFMMSEEGIRWLRLNDIYDPLFEAVYADNLPIYTLPALLAPPIFGSTTSSVAAVIPGLVKEGEQNPLFPLGSPIYHAGQDKQSNM